jgi:hypothetical protein
MYEDSDIEDFTLNNNHMKSKIQILWGWVVNSAWFILALFAVALIWFIVTKIAKFLWFIQVFFWNF